MVLVVVKITPSGIPTSWEWEIIVGFVKGSLVQDTWKKHDLSIQPPLINPIFPTRQKKPIRDSIGLFNTFFFPIGSQS